MADEDTLAGLTETPAPEPAKVEPEPKTAAKDEHEPAGTAEIEAAGEEAAEGSESEAGDEAEAAFEEIEFEGERLKLPKKVAESLWQRETVEQRMAEAAEARKVLEQERAEMLAMAKRTEEDLRMEAQLANFADLISQYKQVDWLKLARENPDEATALKFQYEAIREQAADLERTVAGRRQAKLTEIHTLTEARIRDADDWASANIAGWNQGKDRELLDFAKSQLGYTDVELAQKIDKTLLQTLHLAQIGHQVRARANTQPAQPTMPAPPLRTVRSAKPTNGSASVSRLVSGEGKAFSEAWESNKHRTLASL